ncbi:thiol reductant ABC exporter subunit CydD [Agromyces italicus]|uniref:thiol reductant ABC exporter subunit CydD n=1 Tax=Agromyces italicus TaxID=279572 RepID=UPI00047AC8BA|nr:thiol reductant ABC exporter subunit CydD [Agromyces italicus]
MKPLDPRLVRRSRAARGFLLAGGALAVVQAAAIIAVAWSIATLVVGLIDGMPMDGLWPALAVLVGAACVRALAAWAWELVGATGAQRVKRELRGELLAALERHPGGIAGFSSARIATLLGPGLDALDDYFGRYLPQLVLTVVATPACIAAAWIADPLSGLVLVIVLPLVPVFMALIGMATDAVQRRQWESLSALSRGFLEVVGGLSTLVLYGRAERQARRIREVTDGYRRHTMKVLRITFLSGFALEFAASLSVALVAVSIGLRLVSGDMSLAPGLFVLVLAPEVFLPLRNVGAAFHASAAGVTAADDAFALLDETEMGDDATVQPGSSAHLAPLASARRLGTVLEREDATIDSPRTGLVVAGLAVRRGDRPVIEDLDAVVAPGSLVAVIGPSGSGKSTLFAALLGFAPIAAGEVSWDGRSLGNRGRELVAWAGQSPVLLAGSVAENVRLGDETADPALLERAFAVAGVEVAAGLVLGPGGSGLSGGQAQRVAIARAVHRLLARRLPLLLLDEPTSAQDAGREQALVEHLRALCDGGVTVLVATHRPALVAAADGVIEPAAARV